MEQPIAGHRRPPRVSVVVLNYNGREYLERCLSSLERQTYPNREIILADNGSTDGSLEFVRQQFPGVRVIAHGANLGFSRGNNLVIEATDSEYVLTLNSDTEAEPELLTELIAAAETAPDVGSCAPKMLLYHPPGVIDSAGIEVDLAGIGWNCQRGEADTNEHARREVFGPCAGAALYRRAMLEQIGLFDETYFAFYEDVDLAWRARLAGWRCLYVPTAVVYHVHSALWQKQPARKVYLLARNKLLTIAKNYPWPDLLLWWPLILVYDLLSLGYAILRGQGISALRGRWDALTCLGGALRQRRVVQALRTRRPSAISMLARPRVRLGS